jgi:hypothetical protein
MIDGTENRFARPQYPEQQKQNYSGKKKRHTHKHLAAVDKTGRMRSMSIKFKSSAQSMNNEPTPNAHSTIELSITKERLRQARYSFNLSLIATTVSFFIGFVGAGLILSNKIPEGTVAAAGGLVSSVRCIQLAKDANDRLDKILAEIKNEKK